MSIPVAAFFEATIRTATPLALAALGETVVERAGVINLGLEGIILAGAFGALLGSYPPAVATLSEPVHRIATAGCWIPGGCGVAAGFGAAVASGVLFAALFAIVVVWLRADQIIAGTAINLLAVGATGALYLSLYGAAGAALSAPTTGPIAIPLLERIPLVGRALFAQPVVTYLLYLLVPLTWWWMYRTYAGLALRAVGENPEAAAVAGILPRRVQAGAILFGGALGGLSGGTLVLAQAGTFAEGMSAGRGFIAIGIVVLGRWHPIGTAFAALLFGAANALQFFFQAMGWAVPYQFPLALPYLLTLAGLAGAGRPLRRRLRRRPEGGSEQRPSDEGRADGWTHAPAALGRGL
jgi:simple sugar transport system permease protein